MEKLEWTKLDELKWQLGWPRRTVRRFANRLYWLHMTAFGWDGWATRLAFRLHHPVLTYKLWKGSR